VNFIVVMNVSHICGDVTVRFRVVKMSFRKNIHNLEIFKKFLKCLSLKNFFYKSCQVDCDDGSDETECLQCPEHMFACGDGSCVDYDKVCDGIETCKNGKDENVQTCGNPKPDPCLGFQLGCHFLEPTFH